MGKLLGVVDSLPSYTDTGAVDQAVYERKFTLDLFDRFCNGFRRRYLEK